VTAHSWDFHGPIWLEERSVGWQYVPPGEPVKNTITQSFIGLLRDELLNETLFHSIAHARAMLWPQGALITTTTLPRARLGCMSPPGHAEQWTAPKKPLEGSPLGASDDRRIPVPAG
jgi:hypothetical protein